MDQFQKGKDLQSIVLEHTRLQVTQQPPRTALAAEQVEPRHIEVVIPREEQVLDPVPTKQV